MTNRELHLVVAQLATRHRETPRTLEEYLLALWSVVRPHHARPGLAPEEFLELLTAAFSAPPAPFVEEWRTRRGNEVASGLGAVLAARMGAPTLLAGQRGDRAGYAGWERILVEQVVDLREMAEQGLLQNELRYFGIQSPRGHQWYNFDPCTYLECAAAGTIGGWEPGDDTDRMPVPGPCAGLDERGQFVERDPADVPRLITTIGFLSWDAFGEFLRAGQWYE